MSNIHAMAPVAGCGEMTFFRKFTVGAEAHGAAVAGYVADCLARPRQRRTMRRFARFSDHRLHDIGLERDWDGSVIRRL